MTAKILKENGQVIHLSTYRPLNDTETTDAGELAAQAAFNKSIEETIGKRITQEWLELQDGDTPTYPHYLDSADGQPTEGGAMPRRQEMATIPEELDNYVGTQVNLPRGGSIMSATVKRRVRSSDNQVMGQANNNPILDTRSYMVEFPDGKSLRIENC